MAMFKRVAGLVERFEGSIVYFAGWKVEGILLADQVFMALMKIRQNYPHLHLAQLFQQMIVDCTDIHVAAPSQMDQAKLTYSTEGCTPSKCSSLLPQMESSIFAANSSQALCQINIVPEGVIPPFLNMGKFTESEVRATREIAKNRIHVERANARIKEFRILDLIPSHLRNTANVLVQLCCALVNLQNPLIKEIAITLTVD
ncbi:hypothetical protein NQZ68_024369 [Dissostichus eleginoides]|nr:hypothetical protein NQZ68_024369 [Dissostichus eleginoides]